ncbi:MAG: hypothetical protein LBK60_02145 [Verrucomicrobiales bacterium]|nr:hypothetical protein [Verrucomicrobiales bacterium]
MLISINIIAWTQIIYTLRHFGTSALRHFGTSALRHFGTSALRHFA